MSTDNRDEAVFNLARGYTKADQSLIDAIERCVQDEAFRTLATTARNATGNALTLARALLALAPLYEAAVEWRNRHYPEQRTWQSDGVVIADSSLVRAVDDARSAIAAESAAIDT